MKKEHEAVQRIVNWFFDRYEKPTDKLSSLFPETSDWIYFGGPVNAAEVVHEQFDGVEHAHNIESALKTIRNTWDDLFQWKRRAPVPEQPRAQQKSIDWKFGGSLRKLLDRDGAKLMLAIEDVNDEYAVVALETSKRAAQEGAEAVLDDHGHKVVGYYPTVRAALEAADSFGEAWVRDWKATRTEKCECGPIGEPSTPRSGSRGRESGRARRTRAGSRPS